VNWGGLEGGRPVGVFGVLVALAISPVLGVAVAALLELGIRRALRRAAYAISPAVRRAQWVTSAWLAFSHGSNDAQKTIGVVAVLLLANGTTGSLRAPLWVKLAAAIALTAGTALGGWSIVRTIGRRIYRLRRLDGLVSQASSAAVIIGASIVGAPVSTTQVVSSSVVGTGVGRGRLRRIRWQVVRDIGIAWVTTMPAAGLVAAAVYPLWRWMA
jgi:PiT family inorganic phosphate transporter